MDSGVGGSEDLSHSLLREKKKPMASALPQVMRQENKRHLGAGPTHSTQEEPVEVAIVFRLPKYRLDYLLA